jgi:hypothetical protein
MNNQPALDVHHALEIVRRHFGRTAIAHWLSLRFAEDERLFVATLKLLLPSNEAILSPLQRGDGRGEVISM